MAPQPPMKRSSKCSEWAASPIAMAPAHLLLPKNLASGLPPAEEMPPAVESVGLCPAGQQQHLAPAARQEARTNSQVVCCMSRQTNTAGNPRYLVRGCCKKCNPLLAKLQLNVPTVCVICSHGAGLPLALISQCWGAVLMMLTPPWLWASWLGQCPA